MEISSDDLYCCLSASYLACLPRTTTEKRTLHHSGFLKRAICSYEWFASHVNRVFTELELPSERGTFGQDP